MVTGEDYDVRSNWWMSHIAVVGWSLLAYVFAFALSVVQPADAWVLIGVSAWLFVYLIFGIAALFGFYYDTKAIRDAGRDWSPRWWLYVAGSFLVTPSITSLLYLFQRIRHVGIRLLGRWFGPYV